VAVEHRGEHSVVVVADRGTGMTPEFVRDRLFKPFETTKPAGMGIGVYESAQYVASIGGEISIDSNAGVGTSVELRLPRSDSPAGAQPMPIKEQAA